MYSQHGDLLIELVLRFHQSLAPLGSFIPAAPGELPEPYRQLLDHHQHMTVTVEAFHRSPVDVEVLQRSQEGRIYSREILLRRQSDGRVVQYGIMSIDLSYLDDAIRREILSERVPLGRTLIEHNVLRQVQMLQLWQVLCGAQLAAYFHVPEQTATYGRTARIFCNGEPSVKLLEIVAPCTAQGLHQ